MAHSESIIRGESSDVRVTEWRLAPGETTGLRRHNHDCVVVPLTHGTLRLVTAIRTSTLKLSPGASYFCQACVEHVVFNAGTEPLAFADKSGIAQAGLTSAARSATRNPIGRHSQYTSSSAR